MALRDYDTFPQSFPTEAVGPRPVHSVPVLSQKRFSETESPLVRRLVFGLVLLISALYAAKELKRGWFPWDDGILAQSAEHVLNGQLPHRDYVEIYTGGLSYLNALSFKWFGTNLASMRYMLFLFFLFWVPVFYYAVRRFVSMLAAAMVTLMAVAWAIPTYSAAMPSWYNLFFATFGLAALLRYVEVQNRRWLFLAGLCGGISVLFKVSGLYFIAGALLFFLFREVVVAKTKAVSHAENVTYRILLAVTVLLYEGLVFFVLTKAANAATFPYFWAPNLSIGAAILWIEFHDSFAKRAFAKRESGKHHRFVSLLRELIPFTLGVLVPIAIFLIPYALSRNLAHFVGGVAGSVQEHLQYVTSMPSVLKLSVGVCANLILLAAVFLSGKRAAKPIAIFLFIASVGILLAARREPYVDRAVWGAIWSFLPLVVVLGSILLILWSIRGRLDPLEQQKLFVALSVCAAANLIQFPFSANSYYCHVAPLAFISAAALASYMKSRPQLAIACGLGFCAAYAVFVITPGFVPNMGQQYRADTQTARLEPRRAGGLRIDPKFARTYNDLDSLIKEHSHGEYTFATPNCPEVYFLYGLHDATEKMPNPGSDPSRRTDAIIEALREHNVNLVVIRTDPPFASWVPVDLKTALGQEFPNRKTLDPFEVRWKQ